MKMTWVQKTDYENISSKSSTSEGRCVSFGLMIHLLTVLFQQISLALRLLLCRERPRERPREDPELLPRSSTTRLAVCQFAPDFWPLCSSPMTNSTQLHTLPLRIHCFLHSASCATPSLLHTTACNVAVLKIPWDIPNCSFLMLIALHIRFFGEFQSNNCQK